MIMFYDIRVAKAETQQFTANVIRLCLVQSTGNIPLQYKVQALYFIKYLMLIGSRLRTCVHASFDRDEIFVKAH